MAIKLQKYERQVGPSSEAGGVTGSMEVAGSGWGAVGQAARAVGQVGGALSDIGQAFQSRLKKETEDAQYAGYMANRKLRANALEQTVSGMTEPEDIENVYNAWREEEAKILEGSRLNRSVYGNIKNNYENFYADMDIGVSDVVRKAHVGQIERQWIDVENLALQDQIDQSITNPETGKAFESASDIYKYAKMKRAGLGTVDYEKALKDVRDFGQNQYFRSASKMLTVDYPRFKEEYDSSKLSEYQQQQISLIEQEVEFKIDKQQTQTQDATYNDLLSRYESGLLSSADISNMEKESGQAYGKEFPMLTEARSSVLKSMLYGQEISEENSFYYQSIQKDIGNLSEDQFNTGEVDKIIRKLYIPQSNGTFKPRFSKATTKDLLDQINQNFGLMKEIDVKKGSGGVSTLTTEQKGIFKDITSTFDFYTANAERRGDIAIGVRQIEGLYKKFYEKVNDPDLKAWADEALKPFKQQNATNRAINQYNNVTVDDKEADDMLNRLRGEK